MYWISTSLPTILNDPTIPQWCIWLVEVVSRVWNSAKAREDWRSRNDVGLNSLVAPQRRPHAIGYTVAATQPMSELDAQCFSMWSCKCVCFSKSRKSFPAHSQYKIHWRKKFTWPSSDLEVTQKALSRWLSDDFSEARWFMGGVVPLLGNENMYTVLYLGIFSSFFHSKWYVVCLWVQS